MNKKHSITPHEARKIMKTNKGVIILDVRTPEEYATGKIPGAVLMPSYTIREMASKMLPNKNALILVYCRSGIRSRDAVYELFSMGYTNVYDFGGINAWPYEKE
ncbi:MAG: rhodanese-like domain-containing protein [Defluviitaleaceae bacterium]|nr:rhodanese-like domain-containing protein [Defluviitaleaceae bacterium]